MCLEKPALLFFTLIDGGPEPLAYYLLLAAGDASPIAGSSTYAV